MRDRIEIVYLLLGLLNAIVELLQRLGWPLWGL